MTIYYHYINKTGDLIMRSSMISLTSKLTLMVGVLSLVLAPKVLGYGEASSDTPDCEKPVPNTPWLYKAVPQGVGSIDLTWHDVNNAETWTIAYGTQSGKYIYGLADFGNSTSRNVTINYLPAGTYYLVVRASNGCAIGPFSNEAKVQVSSGRAGAKLVASQVPRDTTPSPTVTPSTNPTKLGTTPKVSPSPKALKSVDPVASPVPTEPTEDIGFWQRLGDFFRRLFGN